MTVDFKKVHRKDLPLDKLSRYWKFVKRTEHIYRIDDEDCILGYISLQQDLSTCTDISVNMFEVFDKGSRIGTNVIENLLDLGYSISGLSLVSVIPFWQSLGADFQDTINHFKLVKREV